jgi:uncharacterized protein involved in exopolysaccharide biosynthesis
MNPTRQQNSPGHLFLTVFTAVFLIVVIISTAITFILPETYASTVRIRLASDPPQENDMSYNPYFIQTTFEIIQSELVLSNVVEKLDLNDTWGKKYFNGEKLKTSESLQILKQRMMIWPVKNTELIYITVYSDDRNEAAQIANAIAESYRDYRIQSRAALLTNGIAVLQQQYEEQTAQIAQAESVVESLRQQFKITRDANSSQSPQEQPYWDKKRDLGQLTDLHKMLFSKIESVKLLDTKTIPTDLVEIVDPAVPGKFPVKPNKPLNIALGALAGVVLGSIIGGLAVLFSSKRDARR